MTGIILVNFGLNPCVTAVKPLVCFTVDPGQ